MTSCRFQSNYSFGGPVVLRPVRATPCYITVVERWRMTGDLVLSQARPVSDG